jgi:hypothetical protein
MWATLRSIGAARKVFGDNSATDKSTVIDGVTISVASVSNGRIRVRRRRVVHGSTREGAVVGCRTQSCKARSNFDGPAALGMTQNAAAGRAIAGALSNRDTAVPRAMFEPMKSPDQFEPRYIFVLNDFCDHDT